MLPSLTYLSIWIVCELFSSFEAGIANAISSFKCRKIFLFMKSIYLQYCILESTKYLAKTKFWDIFIDLKQA